MCPPRSTIYQASLAGEEWRSHEAEIRVATNGRKCPKGQREIAPTLALAALS